MGNHSITNLTMVSIKSVPRKIAQVLKAKINKLKKYQELPQNSHQECGRECPKRSIGSPFDGIDCFGTSTKLGSTLVPQIGKMMITLKECNSGILLLTILQESLIER